MTDIQKGRQKQRVKEKGKKEKIKERDEGLTHKRRLPLKFSAYFLLVYV